jgi:hypothetical protein
VARDDDSGLMGALARTVTGNDAAGDVQVEVHGRAGAAVDHSVSGRVTDAVPHEIQGPVAHHVEPISVRVPPLSVRLDTAGLPGGARIPVAFTLRLRLFGREVASLEVTGNAQVLPEDPAPPLP